MPPRRPDSNSLSTGPFGWVVFVWAVWRPRTPLPAQSASSKFPRGGAISPKTPSRRRSSRRRKAPLRAAVVPALGDSGRSAGLHRRSRRWGQRPFPAPSGRRKWFEAQAGGVGAWEADVGAAVVVVGVIIISAGVRLLMGLQLFQRLLMRLQRFQLIEMEQQLLQIPKVINPVWYERSQERFTWNGVLRPHADPMKRIKILPQARTRDQKVSGSCVYNAIATALEAANRLCGVDVDELAWEELCDMVNKNNPCRVTAALRAVKKRGIRREVDYKKGNLNGKRFKISQFYEFCNVEIIDDEVPCGLDRHNMEAAIKNMLSSTVILAHFPISENYYDFLDGGEHIYFYDKNESVLQEEEGGGGGSDGAIATHVVVVTGFGFEGTTPCFEFLDSNGKKFGKNGFGRILPSSIISLYAFNVIVD